MSIREEAREVEEGRVDKENNVLKHAPHCAEVVSVFVTQLARLREG